MKQVVLVAALSLAACRQIEPTDYGACAVANGSIQPGIGTCLAGPSAIDFVEKDGQTFLVIANGDPYRNFATGSVLFVPFDEIRLDQSVNRMSDLAGAVAFPTDPLLGGLAKLGGDPSLLAVTERFSPDNATADDDDHVLFLDVTDPSAPKRWDPEPNDEIDPSEIAVGRDPQAIVADGDRLYVLNTTDAYVSALERTADTFVPLIGSDDASVTATGFVDVPPSPVGFPEPAAGPSRAELGALVVSDETAVPDEDWTLTWVEGTFRLWAPDGDGLARFTTGGLDYVEGGLGTEMPASESGSRFSRVGDPFMAIVDEALVAFFADGNGIEAIGWDDGTGDWSLDSFGAVLPAAAAGGVIGGPAVIDLGTGTTALFFEARPAEGDAPTISLAVSTGAPFAVAATDVVAAPGFAGVGDPFVRNDDLTGTFRMWVSLVDADGHWSIGLAESADGRTWGAATEVLSSEADLAAPAVTWSNGRYVLWATRNLDGTVEYVRSESYDGFRWSDPVAVRDAEVDWDPTDPPRLALQADPIGSWLVTGADQSENGFLARAGATNVPGAYGYTLRVASGFELGTEPFGGDADGGVAPGSVARIDGVDRLFVTTWDDDGVARIASADRVGEDWSLRKRDLVPSDLGVSDPVVWKDGSGFRMAFAAERADGTIRIGTAGSPDGDTWTVAGATPVAAADWDAVAQIPHSVQDLGGGAVRLWYSGSNGTRFRIGAVDVDGTKFTTVPGPGGSFQLASGAAGDIDDSGVRDPLVLVQDGKEELWYSAFDGSRWRIAHASRDAGAADWTRTLDVTGTNTASVLANPARTFAAGGVYGPVAWETDDGLDILYAGFDGESLEDRTVARVGRATPSPDGTPRLFPEMRPPTPGDQLLFRSRSDRSGGVGLVDLSRSVDGSSISGTSGSNLVLDADRGFLYLTSRATNYVTVIDVRDDSTPDVDDNFLGIEAVLSVSTIEGPRGLRDVEIDAANDRLYVSAVSPEAVFVLDRSRIVDDAGPDLVAGTTIAALPVERGVEDANETNYTGGNTIGPGDLALSADGHLFVPNFAEDALSIFDIGLGTWGREVRTITDIGGNPWLVRLTPDGKYAVVANYLGDVDGELVSATLAIVDADPESPTAFQVLTWLKNR